MLPAFVVDASVAAAWFLPDEATAYTEAVLEAAEHGGLWVPALWFIEMTNLLISAQRRKRIDAVQRRQMVVKAQALRLKVDREPVPMATLDALAEQHALSAYDAVYLELAQRRGLPVATLDHALLQAMQASGVNVADPSSAA